MGRELRYAIRALIKRPTTSLLVIATLTLGIGVATATFSIVHGVLLEPLPYRDPGQLVMVWNTNEREGYTVEQQRASGRSMSAAEFLDWQELSNVFERMVLFGSWFGTITEGDDPETFFGYRVSPGFFDLLGVEPYLGRGFLPEEESPGGPAAIVLQYDFWKRRFNSDPKIVGETLRLQFWGPVRIVGVMPRGFVFFSRQIEAIAAMQLDERILSWSRRSRGFRVVGRLRKGVLLEHSQAQADVFAAQMATEHPEFNENWSPRLLPMAEDAASGLRPALSALLGAVICVLVIMCANVANLMLVQASSRAKDLAVRSALGAGRWRIIRQLLMESLTLSFAGGVLGLGLAYGMVFYFRTLLPDRYAWGKYLVQAEAVDVDSGVILFALAATLASGVFFGLLPALNVTGAGFNEALKDVSRGSVGGRRGQAIRNSLVVAEVALSVVMVIGAGLLIRSFIAIYQQGSGLHATNVLAISVRMPSDDIQEQIESQNLSREEGNKLWAAAGLLFRNRLVTEWEALPNVKAVTSGSRQPISAYYGLTEFEIEGRPSDSESEIPKAVWTAVERNYFEVLGLPLLRGRVFNIDDRPNTRQVAIVSEEAVRILFAGHDPLGTRFRRKSTNPENPWVEVIGVCGDIREDGLDQPVKPYVYFSKEQWEWWGGGWYFVATEGDPYAILPAARRTARNVDPKTILYRPSSIEDTARDSTWRLNYSMLLLSGLAGLALFLAMMGVYGVLAHSVRERTKEIGVRMAMGAERRQVLRLVIMGGLKLVGIGLALGLVAATVLVRFLGTLLYGVEPIDPMTFGTVAVMLVVSALAACYLPARKASRVQPMIALRYE